MKLNVLLSVLGAATLLAADPPVTTQQLIDTAAQLDSMVAQEPLVKKTTNLAKKDTVTEVVPPLSIERIAPIVARKLNIDSKEVAKLLDGDREKLSKIVMARLLEDSTGKTWKQLMESHTRGELMRMTDERQLTATVKKTMDDLYTDVSFVALDRLQREGAAGAAAAAEKGKAKNSREK